MTRITASHPCAVCGSPSVAKQLCDKHYRRLAKHGHVHATLRPGDWGERHSHPLYERWKHLGRTKVGRVSEWDNFWRFVSDVGERPSDRHVLRRLDRAKPYGPTNCYWHETIKNEDKAARAREWEKRNPFYRKNTYLKRMFGITIGDYDSMMDAQGCVCAICKQPSDGKKALAVDHCHSTEQVRGLLCVNCNRGLGHFNDKPELLEAAIDYLQKSRLRRVA